MRKSNPIIHRKGELGDLRSRDAAGESWRGRKTQLPLEEFDQPISRILIWFLHITSVFASEKVFLLYKTAQIRHRHWKDICRRSRNMKPIGVHYQINKKWIIRTFGYKIFIFREELENSLRLMMTDLSRAFERMDCSLYVVVIRKCHVIKVIDVIWYGTHRSICNVYRISFFISFYFSLCELQSINNVMLTRANFGRRSANFQLPW